MRVLRSQYVEQQECVTTTTITALQVQSSVDAAKFCDAEVNAPIIGNVTIPNVQDSTSTTTNFTTQLTAQGLMPIVSRRKSHYVTEQQDEIKIQLESIQRQQPKVIKERRKTVSHCSNVSTLTLHAVTERGEIQINLLNVEQNTSLRRLKLVFDFSPPALSWYNQLYRSYENDMWKRFPRPCPTKNSKYIFQCEFCKKNLTTFMSLKSHLNLHMGWNPFECARCPKQYPSRNSLYKHHLTTKHKMKQNERTSTKKFGI